MKQATHFVVHKMWKLLLIDIGVNPAHALALAGLPADLFSRKGATVSPDEYFRLWRGIEKAAGAEELPLIIGQAISAEAFDPSIFACLCSPDLNTALARLAQYKKLIGPMMMSVDIGQDFTSISLECYGHHGQLPRSVGAMELVFFTQLARLATRERIVPARLELAEPPRNLAPYEEYFGRRINAGDGTRIAFSAKDAARPFLTEDAAMWDFFEPASKKRLSDLETETSVTQRVRSALLEMLPGGQSTIEDAAERLAMSTRTLQRHLRQESSSFQDVLNETRKDLAQHYLSKSEVPPGEISFLLGFQSSNSFLRAFKNWTGMTPGEYRNQHFGSMETMH